MTSTRNEITIGTNEATSPIAMFQIEGDVPNPALTLGTLNTSYVLLTSGKLVWTILRTSTNSQKSVVETSQES